MFETRSLKLERIDTGDYTTEEYDRFLHEIRLVNRFIGDRRALQKTLLKEIEKSDLQNFSVLDIGAGSGELLREIGKFTRRKNKQAKLFGLELNARSADAILEESKNFAEIKSVQANAIRLPFADKTFDYAIASLFTHHLTDENIVKTLQEMKRVVRRKIFIIDLHRHPLAYVSYKIFCAAFRISLLVREDGSLSILRAFKPDELKNLARKANLENISVKRIAPFRLVLEAE
ncbi:MAG: methyltransferase domain-containing protein [Pyrinomonadaceae bacterium]